MCNHCCVFVFYETVFIEEREGEEDFFAEKEGTSAAGF